MPRRRKVNKGVQKKLEQQRMEFDRMANKLSRPNRIVSKRKPEQFVMKTPAYVSDINSSVKIVKTDHSVTIHNNMKSKQKVDVDMLEREKEAIRIRKQREEEVVLICNKGNYQLPSAIDDPNGFGNKR